MYGALFTNSGVISRTDVTPHSFIANTSSSFKIYQNTSEKLS